MTINSHPIPSAGHLLAIAGVHRKPEQIDFITAATAPQEVLIPFDEFIAWAEQCKREGRKVFSFAPNRKRHGYVCLVSGA